MAPAVASARSYLRGQLPGVFLAGRDPVAPALLHALEEVLDPIVAVLDGMPAYLDPELAPEDVLSLLAAWVGIEPEDGWDERRRRHSVARAARESRLRGTRAGLELALLAAFPSLPLRIEDSGVVRHQAAERGAPAAEPLVTVLCDTPLEDDDQRAIMRLLLEQVPAGVRLKLRVRTRRERGGGSA